MGSDFQLMGSVADPQLQVDCLWFRQETRRVHIEKPSTSADTMADSASFPSSSEPYARFADGTPILLSNATSFPVNDGELRAAVQAHTGGAVFTRVRFFGDDTSFMFDRSRHGLICSTQSWPESVEVRKDDSGRPFIGAGIRYRAGAGAAFDVVFYAVMKRRFVPNLEVSEDSVLYRDWFERWPSNNPTFLESCQTVGLSRDWMRTLPLDELPSASVAFYEASELRRSEIHWAEYDERECSENIAEPPPRPQGPVTEEMRALWRRLRLDDFDASVNLANKLHHSGLKTLADLEGKTGSQLLKDRVVGRKTLRELLMIVRVHGLDIDVSDVPGLSHL